MPKAILVIDDEKEIRDHLKRLINMNFSDFIEVDTAENGQEALQLTMKKKYDCIVTDLHMPQMSGVDFINHLRSNKDNYLCPIIVISSDPAEYLVDDFLYISMLSKPFNKNDFLKIVVNQLKIRSDLDEVSQLIFNLVCAEVNTCISEGTGSLPVKEAICSKARSVAGNDLCFQIEVTCNKTTSKIIIGINNQLLRKIKKSALKKSFYLVKNELSDVYGFKQVVVNDISFFRKGKAAFLLRNSVGAQRKLTFENDHIHVIATTGVVLSHPKLSA